MRRIAYPILALALIGLVSCGGGKKEQKDPNQPIDGKTVFTDQCSRCHGSNGKLGLAGAKDLSVTALTPDEMVPVITKGRNGGMMPAFGEVLTPEEIKAVANYVETNLKN